MWCGKWCSDNDKKVRILQLIGHMEKTDDIKITAQIYRPNVDGNAGKGQP